MKEHKGGPGGITGHPGGGNLELADLPRVFGMCFQFLDRSYKDAATQKSHAHRSQEQWLAEAVYKIISFVFLILNVQMELL